MIKKVLNKKTIISTQRVSLRGTNRGVHNHFHAS